MARTKALAAIPEHDPVKAAMLGEVPPHVCAREGADEAERCAPAQFVVRKRLLAGGQVYEPGELVVIEDPRLAQMLVRSWHVHNPMERRVA